MLMLETQLAMQQNNKKIISYISDSTRKHIGRRVLRANSKILFVGIFCLVLASFGIAALIANQKEGSEAVTRSWVVSSSQNGFGGNLGWNFDHNGAPGIGASNNVGENLKIWFPAGGTFNQTVNNNLSEPVHGCWRMPVPANVRVHTVKFRITSNAAGANRIAIGIQNSSGYIEPFVYDRPLNGSEALDFGGLDVPPGAMIQVCNRVTEDGNPATPTTTFGAERYFFVNDYAFFGNETIPYSYDVVDYVNPPSNMSVGETAWVTWRVRNSGNQTWYGEGSPNPTRLGTWNPADRASIFHSESLAGSFWIGRGRIAMQEPQVSPGQIATFRFVVTARSQGSYTEHFNLVTDGIAWHHPQPLFFSVNVGPMIQPVEYCASNAGVVTGSVEAERGVCGPDTNKPVVQADSAASGGKRVLLHATNLYAEYNFKPATPGVYRGGGIMRSLDYDGAAVARISLTKLTPGAASVTTSEDRVAPSASYDRRFMTQTSQYQNLTSDEISKGVSFRVRVLFTNDLNGGTATTDRNLLSDTLYVEKVGDLPAPVEYCANNAGVVASSVEAERGACGPETLKPVVEYDSAASPGGTAGRRVLLYATNQYAEHYFKPTNPGIYRGGAIVKSQDYNGSAVAQILLTKITPGAPSVTTSESRSAPSGVYDRRFMTQTSQYQQLTVSEISLGVTFRVRVLFTNDLNGGTPSTDRNLFVDMIYAEKAAEIPLQCMNIASSAVLSIQAEDGFCGPSTSVPKVQADANAQPGGLAGKRVLLSNTNQFVEYTFKPTTAGVYNAGGIVQSLDYNGSADVRFTFTKRIPGQADVIYNEGRTAPSGVYDRRFITQAANRHFVDGEQLQKGVVLIVRATYINDVYVSATQDRNLVVDTLYIENIQPLTGTGACTVPPQTKIIQAEKASRGPSSPYPAIVYDANAEESNMVFLASNNQYVSYTFTIGPCEAGKYVPGALVRGEQYPQGTLPRFNLSISVNGITKSKEFGAAGSYEVVRYFLSSDYQDLKPGDKVNVRVTFINDARLATTTVSNPYDDRNLIVDDLRLVKLPKIESTSSSDPHYHREGPATVVSGAKNIGNGGTSNHPSGREEPFGTIQAENALRYGMTKPVTDTVRTGYVAAKLFADNDRVRHTFMDYSSGAYVVDVVARSEVLADRVHGQIKITAFINNGKKTVLNGITTQAGSSTEPTQYARKSLRIRIPALNNPSGRHRVTIEVRYINDQQSSTADRNVLVDLIRLRPVTTEQSSASNSKQLTSPTAVFMEAQGDPLAIDPISSDLINDIEPSINCRIRNVLRNCYDSPPAVIDGIATAKDAVRLGNTSDRLTYRFTVTEAGPYVVGFSLKSKDYRGSARARLTLNGNTQEVTAPSSTYQRFAFPSTKLDTNQVNILSVEFLNDQCGYGLPYNESCDTSHDRNLLVDQIQVQPVVQYGQRTSVNRPDEVAGPQIKVFYIIPKDGADHQLDTNGFITHSLNKMQNFIRSQVGQRGFIFDKTNGFYDITFLRSQFTGAELSTGGTTISKLRQDLVANGFTSANRIYAMYYDGPHEPGVCGRGGWNVAVTHVSCSESSSSTLTPNPYDETLYYTEVVNLQEIIHAFGLMQRYFNSSLPADCGPNVGYPGGPYAQDNAHANLANDALSYHSPLLWMDRNRSDYIGHNHPNSLCVDLLKTNYLDLGQ